MALAVKIEVPWDQANRKHKLLVRLMDEEGQPVAVPTPTSELPLEIPGEFEVGRPAGLKPGSPIDFALAANLPGVQLPPGRRLRWELFIDDRTSDEWSLGFTTRSGEPSG